MVGPEGGRNLEIALPGRDRLSRPAEDEIEIDVEPRLASVPRNRA
jgi:hypothetical protein